MIIVIIIIVAIIIKATFVRTSPPFYNCGQSLTLAASTTNEFLSVLSPCGKTVYIYLSTNYGKKFVLTNSLSMTTTTSFTISHSMSASGKLLMLCFCCCYCFYESAYDKYMLLLWLLLLILLFF